MGSACCTEVPPPTAPVADPRSLSRAPKPGDVVRSTDPTKPTTIRLSETGVASKLYETLPAALRGVATTAGVKDRVCFRYEEPDEKTGKYAEECQFRDVTFAEYFAEARKFGRALLGMPGGIEAQRESVCIHGFNHPRYMAAILGALSTGGISVGSYPTNSSDLCVNMAQRASTVVVVADTAKNAAKFLVGRDQLPKLKHIVVYLEKLPVAGAAPAAAASSNEPAAGSPASVAASASPLGDKESQMIQAAIADGFLITWDQFAAKYAGGSDAARTKELDTQLDARIDAIKPESPACYCATSGTTAKYSKLVILTHDCISFECASGLYGGVGFPADRDHVIVSFLPISHIASSLVDVFFPVFYARLMGRNITIVFARTDALKGTLMKTVAAAQPTIAFFVPRLWIKLMDAIRAKGAAEPAGACKQSLIDGAKAAGTANGLNARTGGDGSTVCCTCCYSCTVHKKIKDALGMQRVCNTYVGSAPTPLEVYNFVSAIGLPPLQGIFGMSENTGICTAARAGANVIGTNGAPIPGVEVRIDHVDGRDEDPEDGEILMRGRCVMNGYLDAPEDTAAAIDDDGWLHTGDLGRMVKGCLVVRGRTKELYKTAAGEYVAPLPIEDAIKKACPGISTPVVIAEQRHFVTVLITLQQKPNLETGDFFPELADAAAQLDPECKTWTDAAKSDKWTKAIEAAIAAWNKQAHNTANRVQKFRIVAELSVPGGELTPTLKIKRPAVADKHKAVIDEMYAS